MPHASELHGKYTPHRTNKVPNTDQHHLVNNDTSALNESVTTRSIASAQKIQANVDGLQQIPSGQSIATTSTQGFWTTKKVVITVVIICVCLAVGGGVAAGVILSQQSSGTTTTADTTGSTQSTTAGTAATITTTTTTPSDPCSGGGTRWNTTGTTLMSSSQLSNTDGIFVSSSGTLYVVDEYTNSVIWRLYNNGTNASTIAGIANSRGSGSTQFNYPQDVYMDSNGNLYVTDYYNYRVQKFVNGSTNGTTIAGITSSSGWATSQFVGPRHMTFDATETYMYVADGNGHRIMRHLTNSTSGTSGVMVAGTGGAGNTNTTLYYPWGIYTLPSVTNDLFIANYYGHSVIRWTPGASSGYFVAGTPGLSGQTPILLNNPTGVKIDRYQNIYVADSSNHRIQLFCANNQLGYTIAGTGIAGSGATQLNNPRDVAFDSSMNLYVSDTSNIRIQKFNRL